MRFQQAAFFFVTLPLVGGFSAFLPSSSRTRSTTAFARSTSTSSLGYSYGGPGLDHGEVRLSEGPGFGEMPKQQQQQQQQQHQRQRQEPSRSVLESPYYTASLARIVAAAFAPAGHSTMDLPNIANVFVMLVDEGHMELQATICDEQQCEAVDVPVVFPHPCPTDNNECLLDNLEQLDFEADQILQHAEWEAMNNGNSNHNQYHHQQSQRGGDTAVPQQNPAYNHRHPYPQEAPHDRNAQHQTQNNNNGQLPSWWMEPQTWQMAEECNHLLSLLNEDRFQSERRAMVTFRVEMEVRQQNNGAKGDDDFVVEDVAMVALGPGGFVAQAIVVHYGQHDRKQEMEVAISFPDPASNEAELRQLVADALEFAGSFSHGNRFHGLHGNHNNATSTAGLAP